MVLGLSATTELSSLIACNGGEWEDQRGHPAGSDQQMCRQGNAHIIDNQAVGAFLPLKNGRGEILLAVPEQMR